MADFSRLPGPNADLWDWQLRGLCRGKDSSLFFHPEGERGAARSSREAAAKEICMNCPVLISCAEHALKVREPYGVWGGMTEDERLEHHARQKALARAQAAREKAARAQQAKLKEKLLRDKAAAQSASAAAGAGSRATLTAVRPAAPAAAELHEERQPAAASPKHTPPKSRTPSTAAAKNSPAAENGSAQQPAKSLASVS